MVLVVTVCFLANIWLWSSSTILMWMFWPSLPCCSLVHIELHFFQMKSNGKLCSWTATNTSQTLTGAEISNQDSESQHHPIPQHMVRWWAPIESFWDYQVLVKCLAHPLCHIKRQVGSTLWVASQFLVVLHISYGSVCLPRNAVLCFVCLYCFPDRFLFLFDCGSSFPTLIFGLSLKLNVLVYMLSEIGSWQFDLRGVYWCPVKTVLLWRFAFKTEPIVCCLPCDICHNARDVNFKSCSLFQHSVVLDFLHFPSLQ